MRFVQFVASSGRPRSGIVAPAAKTGFIRFAAELLKQKISGVIVDFIYKCQLIK